MGKKKRKKVARGRRRRRRNPRTFAAPGRPRRAPTPEEVLAVTHEALLSARASFESAESEARLGAELNAYFLRVVAALEDMMKTAIFDEADLRLFALTAGTFLPVLNLKWLPEDPRSFTRELTEPEQEFLDKMRTDAAETDSERPTGRWGGLLDLLTESIAVFIRFGYLEGLTQCYALNEALLARVGAELPDRSD